ncbi:hypothetical protein F5877DRAFT_42983 [Lentinula edodes]|nr:hypothetical protein F5877DRAFT_42983 [Lentinula edodes]
MLASTCTEVSTIFCLSARWHSHHGSPDIVLFTSDSVLFHVHSHVLLAVPDTGFHALIPSYLSSMKNSDPVVHVPESSSRLNIILHAIYNMPCSHFSCPLQDLSDAVDHFALYGMVPRSYILKNSSFYNLLLSYVPHLPLDVYTFASKHELEDLAISASFHLLSFNLSTLTEEMAKAIGPSYLRRLFFLQIGRSDALKRLLLNPPSNHTPTASCDINDQRALTRAWALASAYLVWDSRPDLSSNLVEATFTKLVDDLSCDWCKKNLNERINNLSVHWSHVKVCCKLHTILSMLTTQNNCQCTI